MDLNRISFEDLFKCADFEWYDSPELEAVTRNFSQMLQGRISDSDICNEIKTASNKCRNAAQRSGFEQGFRFAVKLLRNLYDMSFPDVPPMI